MKVLFVDNAVSGHHKTYLQSLLQMNGYEYSVCILPEKVYWTEECLVYEVPNTTTTFLGFVKWIKEIQRIVKREKPDIVHILHGDCCYRYFGYGLNWLEKYSQVVITCHQLRFDRIRNVGYKRISRKVTEIVVHTDDIYEKLDKLGVKNCTHIEYPKFETTNVIDQYEALSRINVKKSGQVLLAIGGTRYDKGLDILLEALKEVDLPFTLLIAGKEQFFKKNYIEQMVQSYSSRVSLILGFLPPNVFSDCLNAADIIVLPYRKTFDGASGPLGESVWLKKQIIGANHGSLGRLISDFHLGAVFESENADSLAHVLRERINSEWDVDDTYLDYRRRLDPVHFQASYKTLFEKLQRESRRDEKC